MRQSEGRRAEKRSPVRRESSPTGGKIFRIELSGRLRNSYLLGQMKIIGKRFYPAQGAKKPHFRLADQGCQRMKVLVLGALTSALEATQHRRTVSIWLHSCASNQLGAAPAAEPGRMRA